MEKRDSDDIKTLFGRFVDAEKAQAAAEDLERAERLFQAYPAPSPSPQALERIRARMVVQLSKKHRVSRMYRFIGAAAAVIVVGIVGLFGHAPQGKPDVVNQAGLLPAAIWESDDIASDDAELAYFASEISRLEARIDALESGDEDTADSSTLDELEIELRLLETQFWKE